MNWMMGSGIERLGLFYEWDIYAVHIFGISGRDWIVILLTFMLADILSSSQLQHFPRLYRGAGSLFMIRASLF
jgi:hypothetical protein